MCKTANIWTKNPISSGERVLFFACLGIMLFDWGCGLELDTVVVEERLRTDKPKECTVWE